MMGDEAGRGEGEIVKAGAFVGPHFAQHSCTGHTLPCSQTPFAPRT